MAQKRILVMVHPKHHPDRKRNAEGTEKDVTMALRRLGHFVHIAGVSHDLRAFEREMAEARPHIVFNLLEEFRHEAVFDFHVVTYLEALGIPYTGCNPRGLILSRNKFTVGRLAASLGMAVPKGYLLGRNFPACEKPGFPQFVKLNREHSSLGIRQDNRVSNPRQLRQICARLRRDFGSEILVQEFIPGDDVSLSLWGNRKLEVFSPRKLHIGQGAEISTARLKFSKVYQRRHSLRATEYKSSAAERMRREAGSLYRALDLSGYARFDYRVGAAGEPYLIDTNANPNIAKGEDFAASAALQGHVYLDLVEEILKLGFGYRPNV